MTVGKKQLDAWAGSFGIDYTARNMATPEAIEQRRKAFAAILDHLPGPAAPHSILEAGSNIGINLMALSEITDADLYAVEPNGTALAALRESETVPSDRTHQGTLQALPFGDGEIDLVFTSGVLIHLPDEALDTALSEIHRTARRYVLALEYFSPAPQAIPYHSHDDFLFKRDYGGLYLDRFDDLEHVANGFFWKRTTGLDDLNWWLFRKRER